MTEGELYELSIDEFPVEQRPDFEREFNEIMDYNLKLRELYKYTINYNSLFTPTEYFCCLFRQMDIETNEISEIENEIACIRRRLELHFNNRRVYSIEKNKYVLIKIRKN